MGKKSVQIVFSIFLLYNLFFKMSKTMKRWWDVILQKKSISPALSRGKQAHIPDLINQSNYRISQDISLQ